MRNKITLADRRRAVIKRFAAKHKGEPLLPHVLVREIWLQAGIRTTDATVNKDMATIIDAKPTMYYMRRDAMYREV